MYTFLKIFWATLSAMAVPVVASAHEMYVLKDGQIAELLSRPPVNPVNIVLSNSGEFMFWAFFCFLFLLVLVPISNSTLLRTYIGPFLNKLKPHAFFIARITFGASLVASGVHAVLFGPEIKLDALFGTYGGVAGLGLILGGMLIVFGLFVRTVAFMIILMFGVATLRYGSYLITYLDYVGMALAVVLVGGGKPALQNLFFPQKDKESALQMLRRDFYLRFYPYRFFIVRVGLGLSIMYAAFYGKFLHSDMALQVVMDYRLTDYFPFEPGFIVLGAGILEMLFGFFFVVGVHLRFSAMFFAVFLFLSYLYFPEAAWPHIILVGGALALFAHGYDKTTLAARMFKRGAEEPIF